MESPKPEPGQEIDWIRRAQRGDRDAFGQLVDRHSRRVFSLVSHLVRRRDDVEDLAQEIFLKAYLGIKSYNFGSSFGTWLGRISVNHCYDYLRRERASHVRYFSEIGEQPGRTILEKAESLGPHSPDAEKQLVLKNWVGALLDRAPKDDRVILVLKEIEELSVLEIAEILGLSQTAVKVRLHRARKRMLEDLKRWREGR
jgi:RNA polymerase sigma-70 factor, ECF subfamily